jgi:hypothetical protein
MTEQEQKEYDEWFNSRPKVVQELILKYPADKQYRIKEKAPYDISCPGTIVYIVGYRESGEVSVAVLAENKLPHCKKHELKLCIEHGRNYDDVKNLNVKVAIDPKWLEVVE